MVLCRYRSGPPDEALIAARAAGKKSKTSPSFTNNINVSNLTWKCRMSKTANEEVSPLNPDVIVNDRSRSHIPFENESIIKHVQHLPVKFSFPLPPFQMK
ncbi:20405_t:CDS:2 [Rhizophagus irregularis]|nr:20405_t:CDS:2 [Rhizophagus irregularis]